MIDDTVSQRSDTCEIAGHYQHNIKPPRVGTRARGGERADEVNHRLRRSRAAVGVLALATSLALLPFSASAALDNKGTDFIVSFAPNYEGAVTVEVHLTADAPTMVTVDYPVNAPSFTTTVNVNPGSITVVSLPQNASTDWLTDTVQSNAVRMSAPGEFVAYMINRQTFTSDAALALPIDTMNTEYIVSTYDEAFYQAQFVVTAAFDATTITITPSNDVLGGHPAGVPYNVVLNRGEGILVSGAATGTNGGLAGSIVSADKPVGVTNGNRCTQVPIGTVACDTLMEIAQPTQSWGLEALVVNLPDRPSGTIYRVLAAQDVTAVTQDGALIGTINRGEYLEVGPIAGNHVFAGDKPIFVTQYMTGVGSPGATTGDPAMGNMIPTEQYLSSYTFATVGAGQFAVHYVTVIADNGDLATILLDGAPIGAGAFTPIPGTNFSGAVIPIPEGTHTTSSSKPHGITVEGLNAADSYLYPGGALFQFINPQGDLNPPICSPCTPGTPGQCTGSATDNRPSEDVNDNGVLDPGEDLNGNGLIDKDTGIFFVELAPGSSNLSLTLPMFVPGTGSVGFTVDATAFPASGTVVATDGAGNTCTLPVSFTAVRCGDGEVNQASEQCDDGNNTSGDGCSSDCQFEDPCIIECAKPGALHVNAANTWLIGTAGNDVLCGDDRNNVLRGNGGSDIMCGFGGNDHLYSHLGGDDYLDGGEGNDILRAESGNDTVIGGPGNDSLFGHGGADDLDGGPGNDVIRGGAGADVLDGGDDRDILNGEGGVDTCVNGETLSNCP